MQKIPRDGWSPGDSELRFLKMILYMEYTFEMNND